MLYEVITLTKNNRTNTTCTFFIFRITSYNVCYTKLLRSSTMTVTDNSEIHRINMKKDTQAKVYFYGSPTIVTDFNVNQGSVIIGDYDHPESTDTIRIKNNFNLYGTLWVNAGVLVIEKELNHFGTIYISNKATVIVNHKWNQSADIYGAKNMICNVV